MQTIIFWRDYANYLSKTQLTITAFPLIIFSEKISPNFIHIVIYLMHIGMLRRS